MLLSLFLLHLFSSSMITATPVRPSSAASNRVTGCQLPAFKSSKVGNYFSSAMNSSDTWFSLEIGYVRLTMFCVSNEFGDEVQSVPLERPILPSELLSLPRLHRLNAGGNPFWTCGADENRWLRLLTQLGSRLVEPALLHDAALHREDATNSSAAELYRMDSQLATNITELEAVENDSAASHYVDLHGEISVPCSRRYFRPTDDVWHPEWHRKQFATQVDIGSAALGAPLMIRGARLAVAGLWRCELAKAGLVLGVRHRIVLRPPFETLEIACYIVAASSSMAMVLIGLAAGLIRIFIRTRCCTRVVHIVEAQSVHNLNASPLQTRRRRQEAADAVVGLDLTAEGGDIEESDMGAVEPWLDGLNPSSSGVGANIRDRMRDINDQLRLRVTNMRAGWTSGVEHVKGQMRSMAEFCGVNNPPLGQTVS
uniref:Ig-like domain-containing protein n=1 Tax=Macrostomum lignano TaxID=282301 RepID=A0A1I8HNC8_9PLAT